MGRCAAFPPDLLTWQRTSPGLARREGKEHPASWWGSKGGAQLTAGMPRAWLVLAAGREDARESICTGKGASREPDRAGTDEANVLGTSLLCGKAGGSGQRGRFDGICCPSAGSWHHPMRGFFSCWL